MKTSNNPTQTKLFSDQKEEPESPQIHAYRYYLKSKRHKESTIHSHINNLKLFIVWAKDKHIGIDQLSYQEILEYVRHLKEREVTTPTLNGYLLSIRKYYEHLKEEGTIEVNPAKKIHIRGAVKKIIFNPLSFAELENLFIEYSMRAEHIDKRFRAAHLRKVVVLGLLVYQGLHSGEIAKLETGHINLQKGSIYIPSGTRSNSRILAMDGKQFISLHRYLTTKKFQGTKLFEGNIRGLVDGLMQEVKGLNPVVKNAGHIRSSVILHWTKIHNKRQVQYMIGHRYISSIEKYQVQDLDSLTDALSKHHPFG